MGVFHHLPIFRPFFHFHENPSSSVISGTFSRENRFRQNPKKNVSAEFGRDDCVVTPQEIVLLGRKLGTVPRMCPKFLCMGLQSPMSCLFLELIHRRLNQDVITETS
jgi:hypothetical protein